MGFNIEIVENAPISEEATLDDALKSFLTQIGYLKRERDSETATDLFKAFLLLPDKSWTVEELIGHLDTTRTTLYYHLNKLKSLDLLDSKKMEVEGYDNKKKVYQFRFNNLKRAWQFVEFHIEDSLKNYRISVNNIWTIAKRERKK